MRASLALAEGKWEAQNHPEEGYFGARAVLKTSITSDS